MLSGQNADEQGHTCHQMLWGQAGDMQGTEWVHLYAKATEEPSTALRLRLPSPICSAKAFPWGRPAPARLA